MERRADTRAAKSFDTRYGVYRLIEYRHVDSELIDLALGQTMFLSYEGAHTRAIQSIGGGVSEPPRLVTTSLDSSWSMIRLLISLIR